MLTDKLNLKKFSTKMKRTSIFAILKLPDGREETITAKYLIGADVHTVQFEKD